MTLGISTSSPVVSVALFGADGLLGSMSVEAQGAASGAVAVLAQACLESSGLTIDDLTQVAVDIGPGGFTGVKVGVTFAKSLAWARGLTLETFTSFDLISVDETVAVPSKRGEWFVREPGQEARIVVGERPLGSSGYGPAVEAPVFPDMSRIALLKLVGTMIDPILAKPHYVAEPSVSIPKNPHVLKGLQQ